MTLGRRDKDRPLLYSSYNADDWRQTRASGGITSSYVWDVVGLHAAWPLGCVTSSTDVLQIYAQLWLGEADGRIPSDRPHQDGSWTAEFNFTIEYGVKS
jgi:hypothetical protein